ncbi:MAG: FHA domain-containing protein [Planctomycetota bacterium]
MTHQLRIVTGPSTGHVLPISAGYLYTVGRGADAQLSIPNDQTLSRHHAEVYFDSTNNAWLLKNKSQHGTLLQGQVFQDHRYIQPGTSFTVGGSEVMFELAGAAGGAAAPGGYGAPAGAGAAAGGYGDPAGAGAAAGGYGAPAGAGAPAAGGYGAPAVAGAPGADPAAAGGAPAAGGGMAGAGAAFGGAMAGAGGALGGALAGIAGGPAKIEHSGPGFPFKALIFGGAGIVKSNLIPSVMVMGGLLAAGVVGSVAGILAYLGVPAVPGILGLVAGLLSLAALLASFVFVPNYMLGIAEYQRSGKNLSIGTLLDFSNLKHKVISHIVGGIGYIPFGILGFSYYVLLEKESVPPVNGLKAGLAYGKRNLVPMVLLSLVLGCVVAVPAIVAGVLGVVHVLVSSILGIIVSVIHLVLLPTVMCAHYLAYDLKRSEVAANAAEDGVAL